MLTLQAQLLSHITGQLLVASAFIHIAKRLQMIDFGATDAKVEPETCLNVGSGKLRCGAL